jgi:hypothetical protein
MWDMLTNLNPEPRTLNSCLPSPPAPLLEGEGRLVAPSCMESAAGSNSGNGRRTIHLLRSRFVLDTSEANQGRTARRSRPTDRIDSPPPRLFRPPGVKPATTGGRSGRRDGCGPDTVVAPTAETRRPLVRPRPPTQARAPTCGTACRGFGHPRRGPIASRPGGAKRFGVCRGECNLPSRQMLP